MKSIVHLATVNFAGLPSLLVETERRLGYRSQLVTRHTLPNFPGEDIALSLPLIDDALAKAGKRLFPWMTVRVDNLRREGIERFWKPATPMHKLFFSLRDKLWEKLLSSSIALDIVRNADIIFLDGGEGFLRSGRILQSVDLSGKKLAAVYYGVDLRWVGLMPYIKEMVNRIYGFEFDHIYYCNGLEHLPFPFDASRFRMKEKFWCGNGLLRVGHSPTDRAAKGTERILSALREAKKHYPVEIVLIEGIPYREAIERKSTCDIFVDQLGELGYGISALEALSMGIPTLVELKPDYEHLLGEHPFITINERNIVDRIAEFFEHPDMIPSVAENGRKWVESYHNPVSVVRRMLEGLGEWKEK